MKRGVGFSTQDKILKAAKTVFFKKGYNGTRTRDIAAAADVNLAMLNYHFKSKERLFEVVMTDALDSFISVIKEVLNDPKTDFETKLEIIVSKYIDKFKEEPQLPYFVVSQLYKSPESFAKVASQSNHVRTSLFLQQYQDGLTKGIYKPINFLHLLMNMGGLIVFPFLISPAIKKISNVSHTEITVLMEERKNLIVGWLKKMISK